MNEFTCEKCGHCWVVLNSDIKAHTSLTRDGEVEVVIVCENCGEEHVGYLKFNQFTNI